MFGRMASRPALPAALAALMLAAPLAAPLSAQAPDAFLPMTTPVTLTEGENQTRAGELVFRGGVEIAPDKADIGGVSGLTWHDGALFAVTDDGRWMEFEISEVAGRLVDVAGVRLGPLLDDKGKMLGAKQRGDAEALTRLESGEWLVAFEQEHRIWRYADLEGPATGSETRAATLTAGAEANGGLETLAAFPGGLLACGEWVDAARPNCLRITDSGAAPFHLAAPAGIAEAGGVPTDAECASDGTCYVLFRSYNPSEGNRAGLVALAPDNTAQTLGVLAPPLKLDNFEGLALREEGARRFLYVISDDNFRNCEVKPGAGCQRTLLYKFAIGDDPAPSADAPVAAVPPRPETGRPGKRPFPEAASVNVVLTTELGDITIALETERAPVTAKNFLRYVDEKRFDGTVFYRAMRLDREPAPNGLLQGGTRWEAKRILPGIPHEPTSQTGLTHTHGAVSMAMGAPGTANGDFSIMIEDQTGLNADPSASDPVWKNGYAVFGYVIGGMDVVAKIHATPVDPDKGEGWMKGEMLAKPVTIITVRRAPAP
jgi:cyclophilin family peptidyl-prolyl cis-trans isomerase